MIRRSSKSANKKQSSKKKTPRTSKKEKPWLTCNLCKGKKSFSTQRRPDMEVHLEKLHSKSREKGVDLKMFFEMLRVVGVIAIGTGLYAIGKNVSDDYIESKEFLQEVENADFNTIVSDEQI